MEWILTSSFLHHLFAVQSDRAELADCWRNNHLPPTTRRCSPRHRRQSLLSRSLVVGFLSSDGCCGSMDTIWSSEDRMGSGPTLRRARPNRPPNGAHALALVGASMCPQTCRNGLALVMSVRRGSLPLRLMYATWCCHPRIRQALTLCLFVLVFSLRPGSPGVLLDAPHAPHALDLVDPLERCSKESDRRRRR